jgi:predicted enzyme related to lactoylglutathione lyase
MPAMDVMDAGRMAILADSAGAVFSIWQAGEHVGAARFGDPGFMTWNELATRDLDGAQGFYGNVFAWSYQSDEMPDGSMYTMISNGEQPNGGMIVMDENWPAEIPPHWMVYFRVSDVEETTSQIKGLGGSISVEPFDTPAGRMAVVADPQGGTFSIIGPAPEVIAD